MVKNVNSPDKTALKVCTDLPGEHGFHVFGCFMPGK